MIDTLTTRPGRSLETLFHLGRLGDVDDGQLLDWFRTRRDERGSEAFRVLVERHGPLVLGICRGILGDPDLADDAFQATFLVLVRKAGSIRRTGVDWSLAARSRQPGRPPRPGAAQPAQCPRNADER